MKAEVLDLKPTALLYNLTVKKINIYNLFFLFSFFFFFCTCSSNNEPSLRHISIKK
jgi:hypothetical protein